MKTNWEVRVLTNNEKATAIYGAGYFPRKYHYKRNALRTFSELVRNGLFGTVVKVAK